MNLIDAIRHHSRVRPYELAVVHPGGTCNYQQLAGVVANLAVRLRSEGVAPGTSIAIYVSDPFLHVALSLAAMVNGCASFSAHPNYDAIPEGAAIGAWLVDRNLGFATGGKTIAVGPAWLADAAREAASLPVQTGFEDEDAVARLFTSSGTTGRPKVVAYTLSSLQRWVQHVVALEPLSRGPHLSMMWMSTIGGWGTLQFALWHGATLVLATAPLAVLRAINLYKVGSLRASPQQLQGLVELLRGRPVRFPSLERVEVGGASLPSNVLLAARASLCTNIVGIYGSTECGLVAHAPAAVLQAHPDAAGYVLPGVDVRIVDANDQPLALDTEGIVQVRTPCLASRYEGDPEASALAFRDGWFAPGDLGVLRGDGLLHIRGRVDEMINAGGVKVAPSLVDEFLATQPGVRDAAAFAYRRPGRHDEVWAAVVCDETFDEKAVLAACAARLNSRAPVRLIRMAAIPRNAMGKAMRRELSEGAAK